MAQMPDNRNEKPQIVRPPEPQIETVREAEERRRVTEITREIEEFGRALDDRDRLARFDTTERAESSTPLTPKPEQEPTVAASSASKGASSQVGKFATITPAIPHQRKVVAKDCLPIKRRKWRGSLLAVIIVLSLVSGGALMSMGPIEMVQDAYRSAVAGMRRLTAKVNTEAEAGARKAAEQKATAEAAARKAVEEKAVAEAAARKAAEEKAMAEATARKTAEEQAAAEAAARRAAEQKLAAEEARLKSEEEASTAAERKPTSDAERKEQAEKAETALALSEQDRKRIQVALNSLGHEIPTVTGYFGPRTRAMIRAWQKVQGEPETGYLTEVQLATLRQQAAAALAKYDEAQRRVK